MGGERRSRAGGWWGVAFVVLLLVSAGMATVPGRGTPEIAARAFYQQHSAVIIMAQLIGLVAAGVFVPFALSLHRQAERGWVGYAGGAVAIAAAATAVPVLWLSVSARSAGSQLLQGLLIASDVADVLLFFAIAAFAAATALVSPLRWLQILALVVAAMCATRAVLLFTGLTRFEVAAPVAFLILVAVLSAGTLARRRMLGPRHLSANTDTPPSRSSSSPL